MVAQQRLLLRYLPDFYQLRNRVKAFVETGDYSMHGNVTFGAGCPSPPFLLECLTSPTWFEELSSPTQEL
ncbi:hypothetical protein [Nocardia salmonicida]